MNQKVFGIIMSVVFLLSGNVFADTVNVTLVDRQPDLAVGGWANQEAADASVLSSYIVVDVSFAQDVIIDSVSTYHDATTDWTGLNNVMARLNIFSSSLGTNDDPTSGTSVAVNISSDGTIQTLTASGLGIARTAGDYYIGLTPQINNSVGQAFNYRSATTGHAGGSQWRNPSGFFGNGTEWTGSPMDGFGEVFEQRGSITITGKVVPEPASALVLSMGMAAVLIRRRR